SFDEVELGYDRETALMESSRCLECGCDSVFVCKLREYATEYGVEFKKYMGAFSEHVIDRSHPFIELDQNKCILCGRCIRVCADIVGEAVYGFHTRGFSTCVIPEMGKTLAETSCISCGLCVETCPTGAIVDRVDWKKPGPWRLERTESTCSYCGVGCSMAWHTAAGKVVKVGAGSDTSPTHGNLCRRGRYGSRYVHDSDRLITPMVDGTPRSWKETVRFLADSIHGMQNDGVSGGEVAVCISPRLTSEEAYLIQKFSRTVLKTHNIFSIAREINAGFDEFEGMSDATFHDIEAADTVLLINADLPAHHPVAGFMVHHAMRHDARRIRIRNDDSGAGPKRFSRSDIDLTVRPGDEYLTILAMMKCLMTDDTSRKNVPDTFAAALDALPMETILKAVNLPEDAFRHVADILVQAHRPVIVTETDWVGRRAKHDLHLIRDLAACIGGRFAAFTRFNNTQGILDVGGAADRYASGMAVDDPIARELFEKAWSTDLSDMELPVHRFIDGLKEKRWKAVFLFGEHLPEDAAPGIHDATAMLRDVPFVLAGDLFRTPSMASANVVIPMCSAAETDGSFTNALGQVALVRKAVEPVNGIENWRFVVELARELRVRYMFDYASIDDVRREIRSLVPGYDTAWSDDAVTGWVRRSGVPSSDSGRFDPGHVTLDPPMDDVRAIDSTNCLWTWFEEYWRRLGRP
ncbi:molybdopterin-dependent oxidoreductase, partial [bacterium]|nr:molybdopterin-dependent oxidoreductase [candidate division CSSED10-310 bacterium]